MVNEVNESPKPADVHVPAPAPVPIDPFKVNLKPWKFSHNNCPEFVVEAASEKDAIKKGLERIGLTSSPHPCRAWPA